MVVQTLAIDSIIFAHWQFPAAPVGRQILPSRPSKASHSGGERGWRSSDKVFKHGPGLDLAVAAAVQGEFAPRDIWAQPLSSAQV